MAKASGIERESKSTSSSTQRSPRARGERIADLEEKVKRLMKALDKGTAARFAADCAERALPTFEAANPTDGRPRKAIEVARSGASVATARAAALAAHAATYAARAGDDANERSWQLKRLRRYLRQPTEGS